MKNFQRVAWCLIILHKSFCASHIDPFESTPTKFKEQMQKRVEFMGKITECSLTQVSGPPIANPLDSLVVVTTLKGSWAEDGQEEFINHVQKEYANQEIRKISQQFRVVFQAPCINVIPVVCTITVYDYLPSSKKYKARAYQPKSPLQFYKAIHFLLYDVLQSPGKELKILQENIQHQIFEILQIENIEFLMAKLCDDQKLRIVYFSNLLYWKSKIC